MSSMVTTPSSNIFLQEDFPGIDNSDNSGSSGKRRDNCSGCTDVLCLGGSGLWVSSEAGRR